MMTAGQSGLPLKDWATGIARRSGAGKGVRDACRKLSVILNSNLGSGSHRWSEHPAAV